MNVILPGTYDIIPESGVIISAETSISEVAITKTNVNNEILITVC